MSIIISGFGFAYISVIQSFAGFFLFYTSLNILFFSLLLLLSEFEVNEFFNYFGFLRYFFGRILLYMMLGIGLLINGISMNIQTPVWQAIRIIQYITGAFSMLIAALCLLRMAKYGCKGTQDDEIADTGGGATTTTQTSSNSRPATQSNRYVDPSLNGPAYAL